MLRCPTEVLLKIFSYLKQSDLFNCMLVCMIFHSIASDHSLCKYVTDSEVLLMFFPLSVREKYYSVENQEYQWENDA